MASAVGVRRVPVSARASSDAGVDLPSGLGPVFALLSDLDGDLRPDLAVSNFSDGTVWTRLNGRRSEAAS